MIKQILLHKTDRSLVQMVRYGLVVIIAAPIDLGGYIILKSEFHIYYVLAATLSFAASLIVNYFLSIKWVWTEHSGRQRHVDATLFAIIGIVGLGITDLVVWIFTGYGGLNYIVSKLIAFVIVFFWSFGARHYLFRNSIGGILPKKVFRNT
jgi:putative flippase GtrA